MSDRDPNVGFSPSHHPGKPNPQNLDLNMTSSFNNTATAHQAQPHHPFHLPALHSSATNAPRTSFNPYHLHMPRHAEGSFDHYDSPTAGPHQALSRVYGVDHTSILQAPEWYQNLPLNLAVEEDMPIGGDPRNPAAPAQADQDRVRNPPSTNIATANTLEAEHAHSARHMRRRAAQSTANAYPLPTGQDSMYRAQHYPPSNLQCSEQFRPSEHGQPYTTNRPDNGAESRRFGSLPYEPRTPIWAVPTEPATAHTGAHIRANGPSTASLHDQGYSFHSFPGLGFDQAFQQPFFRETITPSVPMVPYTGHSSFFQDVPQDFSQSSQSHWSHVGQHSSSAAHFGMEPAPTPFDPLPPGGRRSFMQAMEYATATAIPFAYQHTEQEHGAALRLPADGLERVAASGYGAQSQSHAQSTPVVMGPIRSAQRVSRPGPRRPPNPAQVQHFTALLANDASHDKECPICQDPYNDSDHPAIRMQHVPCNHVFGMKCIQEWVNSGMQNAHLCPSCRQSISGALSRATQGRSRHRAAVPARRQPRARSQRVSAADAPRAAHRQNPLAVYAELPDAREFAAQRALRVTEMRSDMGFLNQRIATASPQLEPVQDTHNPARRTNAPRTRLTIRERIEHLQRTQGHLQQATAIPSSLSVPAPTTTAVPDQQQLTQRQLEHTLVVQSHELARFDGAAARVAAGAQNLNYEDAVDLAAQLSIRRVQLLSRQADHYMALDRQVQRDNRECADEHAALRH